MFAGLLLWRADEGSNSHLNASKEVLPPRTPAEEINNNNVDKIDRKEAIGGRISIGENWGIWCFRVETTERAADSAASRTRKNRTVFP